MDDLNSEKRIVLRLLFAIASKVTRHLEKGSPTAIAIGVVGGMIAAPVAYWWISESYSSGHARYVIGPLTVLLIGVGACIGACVRRKQNEVVDVASAEPQKSFGFQWSKTRWVLTMTPVGSIALSLFAGLLVWPQPDAFVASTPRGSPLGIVLPVMFAVIGLGVGALTGVVVHAALHPEEYELAETPDDD